MIIVPLYKYNKTRCIMHKICGFHGDADSSLGFLGYDTV